MSCADAASAVRTAVALCVDAGWYCPSAAKFTIRLIRILVSECIRDIAGGGPAGSKSVAEIIVTSALLTLAAGGSWLVGWVAAQVLFGTLNQLCRIPVGIRVAIAAAFVLAVAIAATELAAGCHTDAWRAYAN
jgi:hypothetical protein